MAESTVVRVRVGQRLKQQLEALAHRTKRSESVIAAEAIAVYVEREAWQVTEIEKGLQEADAGDFASEAEVDAAITKWSG